jgi:rhodanese-related sulfurtransferase
METRVYLYIAAALIAFFFVRRIIRMRALTQFSPSEIDKRIKSADGLVLLDVRTDEERRSGSIKGSLHIPLGSLRSRLGELEKHRNQQIVCYCASGSRSVSAALLLTRNGFSAGNLRGGMSEWSLAHR